MTIAKFILIVVQFTFAGLLLWSCFCRLTKTNEDTHREIRWSIVLEAIAAMLVLGAPLLPMLVPELEGRGAGRWRAWGTPTWIWLVLLVAASARELVTAKYWRHGAPSHFQGSA